MQSGSNCVSSVANRAERGARMQSGSNCFSSVANRAERVQSGSNCFSSVATRAERGTENDSVVNKSIDELNIYPNPSTFIFTLESTTKLIPSSLIVTNLQGIRVNPESITVSSDYQILINLQNLPDGVYFISIIDNNSIIHKKKMMKFTY
jgi:hypothetical protein